MNQQLPEWARLAQAKWTYRGHERPPFAAPPYPGQESVWDYPRPPRIEKDPRRIMIRANGNVIVDCHTTYRVLETASPPTFYIPPTEIHAPLRQLPENSSACEWKGMAQYWSLDIHGISEAPVAWSYPEPFPGFELLACYFAFYPQRVECFVEDERVHPQPGQIYGGWVTKELAGPFKGEPGTELW